MRPVPDYIDQELYLGYERVYLPLNEVADTPFHTYGDNMYEMTIHNLVSAVIQNNTIFF